MEGNALSLSARILISRKHHVLKLIVLGFRIALMLLPATDSGNIHSDNLRTESNEVLQQGSEGRLVCQYTNPVYGVYWSKGKCYHQHGAEEIIHLDTFFNVGERDGPGYDSGRFNITDEFSLVIKVVKIQDEGMYYCMVSDVETGFSYWSTTNVTVVEPTPDPNGTTSDISIIPDKSTPVPFPRETTGDPCCSKVKRFVISLVLMVVMVVLLLLALVTVVYIMLKARKMMAARREGESDVGEAPEQMRALPLKSREESSVPEH